MTDSPEMSKLKSELAGYTGTDQYHKLPLTSVVATDGIVDFAEIAHAHWLISIFTSYQCEKNVRQVPFQLWEIEVNPDKTGFVTMREDTGMKPLVKQKLDYIDLPTGKMKFYLIGGVLLLPGEY